MLEMLDCYLTTDTFMAIQLQIVVAILAVCSPHEPHELGEETGIEILQKAFLTRRWLGKISFLCYGSLQIDRETHIQKLYNLGQFECPRLITISVTISFQC